MNSQRMRGSIPNTRNGMMLTTIVLFRVIGSWQIAPIASLLGSGTMYTVLSRGPVHTWMLS